LLAREGRSGELIYAMDRENENPEDIVNRERIWTTKNLDGK
jgi:hypothetical protein